mmetsp:Transcript_31445/g.68881  ORF Transcript_31445/g.68881 Transcript_31445/m.68881 type:complete len:120 (+) Transcript_31445:84-443(+)
MPASTWSTGLCECCAQPGGCCLCLRTIFCPCTVVGDINEFVKGPGGFCGGCLLTFCGFGACVMCFTAPQVAEKAGFEESGALAYVKACLPCTGCCYMCEVQRECQILKGGGAPQQLEMK